MKSFIRSLLWQITFNKRHTREISEQNEYDYRVEMIDGKTEIFVEYSEGNKKSTTYIHFDRNKVFLFVQGIKFWSSPRGEALSDFEYEKVKNRMVKFLSLWGDVILDESPMQGLEEITADLEKRGIKFQNIDGIIMYESTVDEEKYR